MNINLITSSYIEIGVCGEILTIEEDGENFKVTAEQGMLEIEESVKLIAIGFKSIELIRCGDNKKKIVKSNEEEIKLTEEEVDLIYWSIKAHKQAIERHLDDKENTELCKNILLKLDDQ